MKIVVEDFAHLQGILDDSQNNNIRRFPFCHEDQANWYVNGGVLQMESFIPSDLDFFVTHHLNVKPPPTPPVPPSPVPTSPSTDSYSISGSTISLSGSSHSLFRDPSVHSSTHVPPNPPFPGPYPGYPYSQTATPLNYPFGSPPPNNPYSPFPYGNYGYSPQSNWIHQGHQGSPAYQSVLFKATELDCPKWDGNTSTWHNMHTKLEVVLAAVNKSYLLTEISTNQNNAEDSKLLFKAMFNKFSGNALVPFTGQIHLFLNKGIEMYRELQAIYAPVDQETLFALSSTLQSITMHRNESVINYVKRIILISLSLTENGQTWPESHLTLTAIKGLDARRYSKLLEAFHVGNRSASSLREFTQILTKYDTRKGLLLSHSSAPQNSIQPSGSANAISSQTSAPTPAPNTFPVSSSASTCDLRTDVGWSENMTKQLMRKYKCPLCRVQDHLWPNCPHLKHWDIKKNSSHPRPNPTGNSNGSANAVSEPQECP